MNKLITTILLATYSCMLQAGFNNLTYHSRANCVNNESITWDAKSTHHLGTNSTHVYKDGSSHTFGSGIEYTHRSAAVHWGEGTGGWVVSGEHYVFYDDSNKVKAIHYTHVRDCSIYDGWWDWNV